MGAASKPKPQDEGKGDWLLDFDAPQPKKSVAKPTATPAAASESWDDLWSDASAPGKSTTTPSAQTGRVSGKSTPTAATAKPASNGWDEQW